MTTTKHDFHITIGSAGRNLGRDIILVKMALLYGDRLTLCSPITSVFLKDLALPGADIIERLSFIQGITADPVVIRNIGKYKYLLQRKNPTRLERALLQRVSLEKINQDFEKQFKDVKRTQKIETLGLEGIEDAVRQGILSLEMIPFSEDFNTMMADFVRRLSRAIQDHQSYPLLDDTTGEIVKSAIQKGGFCVGTEHQSRHIGLASGLLERLPCFDSATIAEVLSIRNELSKPLERFRSAIGNFSQDIRNAPWDEGFQRDVTAVFQEKVKPAVSEIEEEVKTGRFRILFGKHLVANAWMPAMAPLAVLVSRQGDLADLAAFTLATAAATSVGILGKAGSDAYKETQERLAETKKNQMYFYYQASERLLQIEGRSEA